MVTEAYSDFFLYKIGLKPMFKAVFDQNLTYLSFNDKKMQKK